MTQTSHCPGDAELTASLQGNLPSCEAEELAEHIERCPHCISRSEQILSSLPGLSSEDPLPSAAASELTQIVELLSRSKADRRRASSSAISDRADGQQGSRPDGRVKGLADNGSIVSESESDLARIVAPYQIVRELERRHDWELFVAHDPVLERIVWLQVFTPGASEREYPSETSLRTDADDSETTADREEFLRRADQLAKCSHSVVGTVYETHRDGQRPFVVLEAGADNTLDHVVRLVAPGVGDAIAMVRSVAAGCLAAEQVGLVPRSLRLDSIHVTATKSVAGHRAPPPLMLIDFDLLDSDSGTPQVSRKIGELLYELLTGREPARKQLRDGSTVLSAPELIQRLNSDVPMSVVRLIAELLDETRPAPSLQELINRLERLRIRLRRGVSIEAFVAIAALTVVGAAVFFSSRSESASDVDGLVKEGLSPREGTQPAATGERLQTASHGLVEGSPLQSAPMQFTEADSDKASNEKTSPFEPLNDAWLRLVRLVPPEQQLQSVMEELQRRNPGFDGRFTHELQDDQIHSLFVFSDAIRDLSPIRAFPELKVIRCPGRTPGSGILSDLSPLEGLPLEEVWVGWTQVCDLSPLRGMPLRKVGFGGTDVADLEPLRHCPLERIELWATRVTDLSPLRGQRRLNSVQMHLSLVKDLEPLRGMPIRELRVEQTLITDWSALRSMPLETLSITFIPARHAQLLRELPALKTINGQPAADFFGNQQSDSE